MNTETVERAKAGNHQAQAEIITYLENGKNPEIIFGDSYHCIGNAHRIGITGPPGAGKSTVVSKLITEVRRTGSKCAVVACDPSSPYTHGALLGDRTRMVDHFTDPGVFIRSMATRGNLGGLAPTTSIVADFLDFCGYPVILIETVGVGQTEVDVVSKTDTVVVIITPESGDSIQMMKAGLLEGADIFCINKTDRPGGDVMEADLTFGLGLSSRDWAPPIVKTIAKESIGISELYTQIKKHMEHLIKNDERNNKCIERYFSEIDFWLESFVFDKALEPERKKYIQKSFGEDTPPWTVAKTLWKNKMEEPWQ
ncbi:MAG TPA: methylmalonyl Co-A mutase-associated GTPase MeaB [Caldisericia bacterium]|nr:MAG: putative GTPase [bacterium ADurb.Bin132]HNW31065.1 methylmalonyl Co-A mutase-associated GTPase MeaB [Caldisericia bacterium]HNY61522.1 methylmalonyl Co-A mutase-associated GTPase MeaB [Caldisericia bacterium]HOC79243.1 methylmalonyl Co-A mutase-associated GTPase MeaB [Caldisericia bacterium]HOG70544.1 methylmalonyl Co-A mutase-associated GTPase MeaB [Caldisericia bacterium]